MQIPRKRKKSIKRHFQLLEVMVAAFIILICAVPALKIFTSIYLEQQEVIRENQRDHIARLIHASIVEQLYKRTIPLEDVLKEDVVGVSDSELEKLLKEWAYEANYSFREARVFTKRGDQKPSKYLVKLIIVMKDVSKAKKKIGKPLPPIYDYDIYIDSGALEKGDKKTVPNDDDTNDEDQTGEEENRFDGSAGPNQQDPTKPKDPFANKPIKPGDKPGGVK